MKKNARILSFVFSGLILALVMPAAQAQVKPPPSTYKAAGTMDVDKLEPEAPKLKRL